MSHRVDQPPTDALPATRMALLVDRDGWLERLDALMSTPSAIVTLVGPPGIGKTAIARQWASQTDGVGWVDVDANLGSTKAGAVPLVFDASDRAPDLVRRAITTHPGPCLVTSRRALHLPEETVLPVPPLGPRASAQLFEGAAPLATSPELQALLVALDGNPLAILWAAERTRLLSPNQLHDWIRQNITTPDPAALPPHVAALGAGWDSLGPTQRECLLDLASFEGDFLLTDVAARLHVSLDAAHEQVQRLIDRSWIAVRSGEVVTLRLFAAARWYARLHREARHHHAHAIWLIEVGRQATGELWSAQRSSAMTRLDRHWPDLRGVWPRLTADERARALVAWRADIARSLSTAEALSLAESSIQAGLSVELEVAVCGIASTQCRHLDRMEDALVWANRGVLASKRGSPTLQTQALTNRGDVHLWAYRLDQSIADLELALSLAPHSGSDRALVWRKLAGVLHMQGSPEAESSARKAAELAGAAGDTQEEITALCHSALYATRGNPDALRALSRASKLAAEQDRPDKLRYVVLSNEVLYHARFGDLERGQKAFAHILEAPPVIRSRLLAPAVRVSGVLCHLLDPDEPEEEWLPLVDPVRRDGGAKYLLILLDVVRGWRHLLDGELHEARRLWEQARRGGDRPGDLRLLDCLEALALATEGRTEEAAAKIPQGDHTECAIVRAVLPKAPDGFVDVVPGSRHRIRLVATAARRLAAQDKRVLIATDASWFRIGQTDVSLTRRPTQRRVLHALVQAHQHDATQAVSADALIEAGWPGERVSHQSARQRLWATIRLLRAHGLSDALATVEEGYRLEGDRIRLP